MRQYDEDDLARLLPHPEPSANKYSRGKLNLLVGSAAYPGAACLAALAAQSMGAGYVEVFTHEANVDLVRGVRPSLVVRPWRELVAKRDLEATHPARPIAYLVGSGFAYDDSMAELVFGKCLAAEAPVVMDGGALSFLPRREAACAARKERGAVTVLTPHGGEAVRLAHGIGLDLNALGEDPTSLAEALSKAFNAYVVLKGPDTYITDGVEGYWMQEGTAALAKAGTGDVLAGLLSSLLAQNLDPFDACALATVVHARAGVEAARRLGDISAQPEDVIASVPTVLQSFV